MVSFPAANQSSLNRVTAAMTTNSQIILDGVLKPRQNEMDPDADPTTFFELFTAQQILKDFDLSYEEIESGLVGAGGDGGVDSIYLLVNGDLAREDSDYSHLRKDIVIDLIIIQSKTHAGFQETPVERFITVSRDLFDLSKGTELSEFYNKQLVEAIDRFRNVYQELTPWFPTFNVSFFYASKGVIVNDNVRRKVELLEEVVLSRVQNARFDFRFLGASELYELAGRQPHTTFQLPLAENPISSEDQVGFVCLVRLRNFFDFITDDTGLLQRQLFEANVRDYQGRTQVNDEIQASLQANGSEDFWWLNNGVSILATQASLGGKTLTIKDPQIVNGLQTSTEVYNYSKNTDISNDGRKILVKVMVPNEDESRDHIIKATNSQTVVPPSSLRATDRIHRNIEEYLRQKGLFYDRRKNYYKNEGRPRDKIVGIPYLAQAVMAIVLQQPDQARARPSSLLKNDEDYQRVFNQSYPIGLYYVCAEAMRRIEFLLKSPSLNVPTEDRNNLRFYVAMCAVSGVGNSPKSTPTGIAKFDVAGLNGATVQRSLNFVQPKYITLGANDQVSKGPQLLQAILDDGTAIKQGLVNLINQRLAFKGEAGPETWAGG